MNIPKNIICVFVFIVLQACSVSYSLTGGSINYEETKTINIQNFYTKVAAGPADLALRFTEELKEFIQQRTKLEVVNGPADLQLEGYFNHYGISPQGATVTDGEEFAALNLLKMRVNVTFSNFKDQTQDYQQDFSSPDNLTYGQDQSLAEVEDDLIEVAFDQIKQDIYIRCFSNW